MRDFAPCRTNIVVPSGIVEHVVGFDFFGAAVGRVCKNLGPCRNSAQSDEWAASSVEDGVGRTGSTLRAVVRNQNHSRSSCGTVLSHSCEFSPATGMPIFQTLMCIEMSFLAHSLSLSQ